jgi:hypothetical protein
MVICTQVKCTVPWHSLYKHSLYVTKFIRTFFIRDRVYTGQSLYGTKFIRGQNLYEDKVYTGTKFIWDKVYTVTKFIRGQSLYKLFSYCTWIKGYKVNVKNMCIIQSNHIQVCNCYCYCLFIIPWIYGVRDRLASSEHREHTCKISMNSRWICTEGDGYIIWGKGLQSTWWQCICRWRCIQSLMILYELKLMVSKKLHGSILLLYI